MHLIFSIFKRILERPLKKAKWTRSKRVDLPISKCTGGTLPGVDLNRSANLEDRMREL
jgi:hypothetical protein